MILQNEKYTEITCQNINLLSSAVCTISIWPWRQRILLDKMLDVLSNLSLNVCHICIDTKVTYRQACTTTWRSHRLHCEVEIVQSALEVASEVRVTYQCNGNAQFTNLDALSKHACKTSPAEHIRTRKKLPRHAQQPQDHNVTVNLVVQIVVYVWLSVRFWALA